MTVKELINHLGTMNPDLQVYLGHDGNYEYLPACKPSQETAHVEEDEDYVIGRCGSGCEDMERVDIALILT